MAIERVNDVVRYLDELGQERGVPPGVYYYQLENIDGVTATGVLSAHWEERP